MSRRIRQQVRSLTQRAGRMTPTKSQSAVYLPMTQDQGRPLVHHLFPTVGRKTRAKMARVVSRLGRV